MGDVGANVLCLAALTAPWGAVSVSGLQLVDGFLVISLAIFSLEMLRGLTTATAPKWVAVGAVSILVVMVCRNFVPPNASYLSLRAQVPTFPPGSQVVEDPLLSGAKWLVALLVMPVLVVAAGYRREIYVRRIALSWLAGVVISASVALSDYAHITSVSRGLLGFVNLDGRQSGLSTHPNSVGVACALALPLGLMVLERRRVVGSAAVMLLLFGAITSGSRGAQAGFLLALMITLFAAKRFRQTMPRLLIAVGLAFGVVLVFSPSRGNVSGLLRFAASDNTVAASDQARSIVAAQGKIDFQTYPFAGIGLDAINYAHNIYLQLLSAGGIVLFIGFLLYIIGALRAGWRLLRSGNHLAPYLFAAVSTWMLVGIVENPITDLYLYIPVGCIAALQMLAARPSPRPALTYQLPDNTRG